MSNGEPTWYTNPPSDKLYFPKPASDLNYPQTADEMLLLVLATTTDIASKLYSIGDKPGAEALAFLIMTLEEFREIGKSL